MTVQAGLSVGPGREPQRLVFLHRRSEYYTTINGINVQALSSALLNELIVLYAILTISTKNTSIQVKSGVNLAKNFREKFLLSKRNFERSLDLNFRFSFSLLP